MQTIELTNLSLTSKWKAHLVKAGFLTTTEVLLTPPPLLSKRTNLSLPDINSLLLELSLAISALPEHATRTVYDLVEPAIGAEEEGEGEEMLVEGERRRDGITTGDAGLDALLGGEGIKVGSITEVTGESASGKSHLCLQLSLTTQLPRSSGGLRGGTLFISSEGAVPSGRLLSLACSLIDSSPALQNLNVTPREMMDNIHFSHTEDIEQLIALLSYVIPATISRIASASNTPPTPSPPPPPPLNSDLDDLPSTSSQPLPIKLLIIDSIAAPFRASSSTSTSSFITRSREFALISDLLKSLSTTHNLSILIINQVTSVFTSPSSYSYNSISYLPSPSTTSPTSSAPNPDERKPPHEQYGLPPLLYARFQTPFYSGETPSVRFSAALGPSWASNLNTRIMLSRTKRRRPLPFSAPSSDDDTEEGEALVRKATLVFSPYAPRGEVEFALTDGKGVWCAWGGEVRVRVGPAGRREREEEGDGAEESEEEKRLWEAVEGGAMLEGR